MFTNLKHCCRVLSPILLKAFDKRKDLRPVICSTLKRMYRQNRAAAASLGFQVRYVSARVPFISRFLLILHLKAFFFCLNQVGFPDPAQIPEELGVPASDDEQEGAEMPQTYSAEMTSENLAVLQEIAGSWLSLLLNTYLATSVNQQQVILSTISSLACLADTATVAKMFRAAISKLIQVVLVILCRILVCWMC